MLLSLLVCFMLGLFPTLLAGSSKKLSCQLQCYRLDCDIPPSVNISSEPLRINSSSTPCPRLGKSSNHFCYVTNTTSPPKLTADFRGHYRSAFNKLVITAGNLVVFRDLPCIYERPPWHISVSADSSHVVATSIDASSKPHHGCHAEDQLRAHFVCRSQWGEQIESTFLFTFSRRHRLQGLRPFSWYNCSSKLRYEHNFPSRCTSIWSDNGSSTFRTPPAPLTTAPQPLGFLCNGSTCHVYFVPIPAKLRNGRLEPYKWTCGDYYDRTTLFSVKVNCAGKRFRVWGRNEKGDGPKSAPLTLQEPRKRPGLQLWSEGDGVVRPKLKGQAPPGSLLMVCGCGACEDERPSCVNLTTRPVAPFRVDLRSHRVALFLNGTSGPVMSDWVSCSYDQRAASAALRTSRPLNELARVQPIVNDRLRIVLPATELRCPRVSRPIDVITVRRSCGQARLTDKSFNRSVGDGKAMEFYVDSVSGCEVLLSADNKNFFRVWPRNDSRDFVTNVIVGVVVCVILLVSVFLVVKYRQAFINFQRKLCQDPDFKLVEAGAASPLQNDLGNFMSGTAGEYGDGYADLYVPVNDHPTSFESDEGVTFPARGTEEANSSDNYTPQLS